jgi:hypothetical protein
MTPIERLRGIGQSLWLDSITRGLLTGEMLRRFMQSNGLI